MNGRHVLNTLNRTWFWVALCPTQSVCTDYCTVSSEYNAGFFA